MGSGLLLSYDIERPDPIFLDPIFLHVFRNADAHIEIVL